MKPTEVRPSQVGSHVAVCIATRRRPTRLQRLLESVGQAKEELGGAWHVRVYVVDNDPAQSTMVMARDVPDWVHIFHEPREGIPFARNRALQEALPWADWIAFVDDDEWVTQGWLRELLRCADVSSVHAVAGPVVPEFQNDPPRWVREVGLVSRRRHRTGEPLREARTGNLLLHKDVLTSLEHHFDTRLAHVGGSDTELTRRIAAQHPIMWCDEAIVYEIVPEERTSLGWHLRRSWRIGANRVDRARLNASKATRALQELWYVGGALGEMIWGAALIVSALVRGHAQAVRGGLRIVRSLGTLGRTVGIAIWEYPPLGGSVESSSGSPTGPDFIVGCGRSGTTLLRAMLDAHPEIAIPGETHLIPTFLQEYGIDVSLHGDRQTSAVEYIISHDRIQRWEIEDGRLRRRLSAMKNPTGAELIDAAFAAYADAREASVYLDKTPEYVRRMELLSRAFPESRFIHLIRDPRDTAASLVEASWGPTDFVSALRFWKKRVTAGQIAGRRLGQDRYHELHYEALVRNPAGALRGICDFLDVPFREEMTRYWEQSTPAGADAEAPSDHRNVTKPPRVVRNWRSGLAEHDRVLADLVLGEIINSFGYETSGVPARPRHYAYSAIRWVWSWISDMTRWIRTPPSALRR